MRAISKKMISSVQDVDAVDIFLHLTNPNNKWIFILYPIF